MLWELHSSGREVWTTSRPVFHRLRITKLFKWFPTSWVLPLWRQHQFMFQRGRSVGRGVWLVSWWQKKGPLLFLLCRSAHSLFLFGWYGQCVQVSRLRKLTKFGLKWCKTMWFTPSHKSFTYKTTKIHMMETFFFISMYLVQMYSLLASLCFTRWICLRVWSPGHEQWERLRPQGETQVFPIIPPRGLCHFVCVLTALFFTC